MCFNALETGHLEQVSELAQLMLEKAKLDQLVLLQGWAHYFLGVVHYGWNELDAAAQHFDELVANRYVVHALAARNGMIGLARVHAARGEHAAAWQVMELLSQLDLDRLGQEGDDARSLRTQLADWQGDTEGACRWADAYVTPVPDRLVNFLQDPHLAQAGILLARGKPADMQAALGILAALHAIANRACSVRLEIEILALRAVALAAQGKTGAAMAALQQAVDLAQPGGFIRVFIDLGPPLQAMLQRLAAKRLGAEKVRRILAAFPEPQEQPATGAGASSSLMAGAKLGEPLTEPITGRELEILALLRERLSDKEIARRLGLSTATVKRYAVNLYSKLGVNRRWDAVIKAETLRHSSALLTVLAPPARFRSPFYHPLGIALRIFAVDWWHESCAARKPC